MILNVRVKKMKFALEEKREQRVILNLISHLDQKINLKIRPSIDIKKHLFICRSRVIILPGRVKVAFYCF